MNNVDATERITIGDEVVTAGITLSNGIRSPYPKGLVIGQIVDATRDPNAVIQTAYSIGPRPGSPGGSARDHGLPGRNPDVTQLPTEQVNPDGTLPGSEQPFATPAPTPRPPSAPSRPLRRARSREGRHPRRRHRHAALPAHDRENKHLLPIYDRPISTTARDAGRHGDPGAMVIVGGKSVGDVVELLGDGEHFGFASPTLPARCAGDRPRDRPGARLRGDDAFCCVLGDNILRGPRSRPSPASSRRGPGRWDAALRGSRPGAVRGRRDGGRRDGHRLRGEAGGPKSDLIPIGVYFRARMPSTSSTSWPRPGVASWRYRRAQPLHPGRPAVCEALRRRLGGCRDRGLAASCRGGRLCADDAGELPPPPSGPRRDRSPAPGAAPRHRRSRLHRQLLRPRPPGAT